MSKLIDLTKPVQTRDGRQVRILCCDAEGPYPVIALLRDFGGEVPMTYTFSGCQYGPDQQSSSDLVNVPEKPKTYSIRRWIGVDERGIVREWCSRPDEIVYRLSALKEITIEITEGEGL